MCQVSHKHITANNKYMKSYNKDIVSSYINYLDANALYALNQLHKNRIASSSVEWDNLENLIRKI